MKKLDEIIEDLNLEILETTQGSNGYPSQIGKAYTLDDANCLNFAENYLKELGYSVERYLLRKRDGWHFYEFRGNSFLTDLTEMTMNESDFYCTFSLKSKSQLLKQIRSYVIGNESINKLVKEQSNDSQERVALRQFYKQKINKLYNTLLHERQNADKALVSFDCNNDNIDFIVTNTSTGYYYDVWSYKLALVISE